MTGAPFLRLAIDTPLRRAFDYRAPDGAAIQAGERVWAPFGRRRVVGVVLEQRDTTDAPVAKLRAVQDAIDGEPTFDAPLLALLVWAAEYYRHPIGEVVASALPAALRAGQPLRDIEIRWRLTSTGRQEALAVIPSRASKQRAIVEFLLRDDGAGAEQIGVLVDDPGAALRALEKRGFVERVNTPRDHAFSSFPRTREPRSSGLLGPRVRGGDDKGHGSDDGAAISSATPKAAPLLNPAQQSAVERIAGTLGAFASHLVHGVTGSGKTEVYLHAIAQVLARGEQALVLVPEIGLTPQLIARFEQRFSAQIAVVHSGLTDLERLHAWRAARAGAAAVVIGTRSAVFTPLARPGLIVVDEEHDASFKQQEGFRYSARDLAIVRAQRLAIPVVLGSATPSLETLARTRRQSEWLSRLPQRAGEARPPRLALIDLRRNAQTNGIATPALLAIRRHLEAHGQVLLFLNRRGYAPVLFCAECGWSAHCQRCDAHLTLHGRARLLCHHCGAESALIQHCPTCFAPTKPVGQGTERIEETLREQFPDAPLARIDRDSIRRKGELEAALERVRANEVRILVGTQMLTKGHDFPNVTLVVVLNADQGLFSADFRASERLAQTIVQVAGRAGRAERAGEVLIQTGFPDHPLLTLLLNGGYDAFADGALAERETAHWPPFARIALVRAESSKPNASMQFLQAARTEAQRCKVANVRLLGPAPAPMERRAGRHRAQLLIHAPSHAPLQKFLKSWLMLVESLPDAKRVRWSIDVDPAELF